MGRLDSDCSGLERLWMCACACICAALGVMLQVHFTNLFVLMILFVPFMISSDILRLHIPTSLSVWCVYVISSAPFMLWWNLFRISLQFLFSTLTLKSPGLIWDKATTSLFSLSFIYVLAVIGGCWWFLPESYNFAGNIYFIFSHLLWLQQ